MELWGGTKGIMTPLVEYCDIILGNEEDAESILEFIRREWT